MVQPEICRGKSIESNDTDMSYVSKGFLSSNWKTEREKCGISRWSKCTMQEKKTIEMNFETPPFLL